MPRGGPRPGSGAPKGNTNALKTGAHSARLKMLMIALRNHPNLREIYRIGRITGVIPRSDGPGPTTITLADITRMVEVLYPAIFDSSHPWFNQINQKPESGWPRPWPGPRIKKEELQKV